MSLLVSTFHFRPLIPPAKSVSWSIFVQRRRIPPHLPCHSTALFLAALVTNDPSPQEFVTMSRSRTIYVQRRRIHPISLAIQPRSFLPSLTIQPRSLLPPSSPTTSPLKNSSRRLKIKQFSSNVGGSPISLTIQLHSFLPLSSPTTSSLKNSSRRLEVRQFSPNISRSPIPLSIHPCPFLPLSSPTSLPLKNSSRSLEVGQFLSDVGGSSSPPHLSATLFPAALISNNLSLNTAHLEGCLATHPTNGLPLPCGLHL